MKTMLIYTFLLLNCALASAAGFGPGQTVRWEAVTAHEDGTPCEVGAYQLAIVAADVDLNLGGAPLAVINYGVFAYTGLAIDPLLQGLESAGYRLQARAQNTSGVWGRWSAPLAGTYDKQAPGTPKGMRVK